MSTIRDVAREAGVSIATVSRVFNESSRVTDDTRERVLAAAHDLKHWPNGAARSLTTSRTHALGVLLPDLHGEFFSEVIRGIDSAARSEGLQVLISGSHADTKAVISAARAMRGRVDGVVMMASDPGSFAAVARIAERFPTVLVNPMQSVAGCRQISVANFDGARAIVTHLIELGHRAIALISGPRGNVDAEERRRGYLQGLRDAGIDVQPQWIVQGEFSELSGHRAAQSILTRTDRPSAVFAANDSMAVGLIGALLDKGVDVPGSIAVVGFDDIAIARYLRPALTTVHVDTFRLGELAVRRLMSSLAESDADEDEKDQAREELFPVTLMVRQSCGAKTPGEISRSESNADNEFELKRPEDENVLFSE